MSNYIYMSSMDVHELLRKIRFLVFLSDSTQLLINIKLIETWRLSES